MITRLISHILFYIYAFTLAIVPTSKFVEGIAGQPVSFLPHQATTQGDKTISGLVFRGLFKYDNYGSLVPDLADTWAISDDGLTYTIKLKDNQKWSDGQNITADDLIYTAFKIEDLSGVATDKVDNLTVRYTLPNKFSPFLSMLTVGVMPTNAEESYDPILPITSGPFRVLRIEKSGPLIKQVILLNETPQSKIQKLVFRYYANDAEIITAAKLGEIDGFVSQKQLENTLENFEEYKYPSQGVYYAVFFNLRNPKVKDLPLRQNMQKVLPIKAITNNYGIPVQGAISRSQFTDETLKFDSFDPKTKESSKSVSLDFIVPNVKQHVELAKEIKGLWEDKLNIDVNIKIIEPNDIYEKVLKERNFDILFYGQEVVRDPDRYVSWHSTQKDDPGLNISGFDSVRADRALEEGRKEIDNEKRLVHYHDFQKTINDQVPAIFFYHPYFYHYISKYIDGVGEKYTFSLLDRFLDFRNWSRIRTN